MFEFDVLGQIVRQGISGLFDGLRQVVDVDDLANDLIDIFDAVFRNVTNIINTVLYNSDIIGEIIISLFNSAVNRFSSDEAIY